MNGSLIGLLTEQPSGGMAFDEAQAFPLPASAVEEALAWVGKLLADGFGHLLLFYYPRDWRRGEIIWTPLPLRIGHIQEKYKSAARVHAGSLDALRAELESEDFCMMFLLVEETEDRLMAYQHIRPANFITAEGVDKLSGWRWTARWLGLEGRNCAAAGDTQMDNFLQDAGLAIRVGSLPLPYRGRIATIEVIDSRDLGALLFDLAELGRLERV
jgi:hypothetical protein